MKGLVVYKKADYLINQSYADMLVQYGLEQGLEIQVALYEELRLGVGETGLWIKNKEELIENVAFVINRSRESMLSKQLELMHIPVFNSYEVTHLANHKGRTHQFVSSLGIPSMRTSFFYSDFMEAPISEFPYPFVMKTPDGHGGQEVFCVQNEDDFNRLISTYKRSEWLIQEMCAHVGEDVRVFVIGNKIIGAIRRFSETDFRANYCLGGQIEWYTLNEEEEALVYKITKHLSCDYVGIDFMIDDKGKFVFNEIEDVVGSRSLYALKRIDTAKAYILHIKKCLE